MKVLACVFNAINYDGRVQRAAEALNRDGDVHVLSIHTSDPFTAEYHNIRVRTWSRGALKYLSHVWFMMNLVYHAIRLKPQAIHAHDYYMAFPGWLASRVSNAKFIYDAHELIVPDDDERTGRRESFWYRLERWSIRRANLVIAANRERALRMAQHYGLTRLPTVVRNIPPAPASITSASATQQQYSSLRPSSESILIAYQGVVGLGRGLGEFVNAISFLPDCYRLVVVGSGPDMARLRELVDTLGVQARVLMLGKVPRDHLHEILQQCDLGIVTYPYVGSNNIYCASNKLFEYAQAGLPVISTSQPPLRDAINQYGVGEVVEEGVAPASVAKKIEYMVGHLDKYRSRLDRFLAENSWEEEAEALRHAIWPVV